MYVRPGISTRPFGRFRAALAALVVSAVAVTTGPARALATAPEQAERRFTAMTYNMYIGANLQPLFGIQDPVELMQAAGAIFGHVDRVDFNERAVAIARQIGEAEPDVVGVQEVALWRTAPLSNPNQVTTRYDFLEILLDELERQGHPYRSASVNPTFSGALPISPTTLGLFTDRNAIIVRADDRTSELRTSNPSQGVYETSLPAPIGGQTVPVRRGWASVDLMIRGKVYRFFDTHFEAYNGQIRLAQVSELVARMSTSPYPVVLVGDINLYPQGVRSEDDAAWSLLRGAGFVDTWVEAMDGTPGYTAGQTDDLNNVPSTIDHTVDFVLHDADGYLDAVPGSGDIVGEELDDRTDSGLWPSDHAGVVVTLHIAKP